MASRKTGDTGKKSGEAEKKASAEEVVGESGGAVVGDEQAERIEAVEMLSALVRLDAEAAHAYLAGADSVSAKDVQDALRAFAQDHLRHVKELGSVLAALGEADVERKLEAQPLLLPVLARMAAALGPHDVILALLNNEQLTNLSYADALAYDWDDEAEALLQRNLADEERHLEWLTRKHEELGQSEARTGEEEGEQPSASP